MDLTFSFMLPILQLLEQSTHSYGWSLVLLTLLVRVMLWPLVSKQTESMQRMSQLQPMLKQIQERYKDNPEVFQRKAMEFYKKNQVNPMGGCLPMLLQIPIFFALFATFSGPPFGDKPIPAHVKVVASGGKEIKKEVSNDAIPYVSKAGDLSKVVVYPGEVQLPVSDSLDFGTRAVVGKVPEDFKPVWHVIRDNKPALPEDATIDESGHAVFKKEGDYQVQAIVPGVAKNDQFLFVSGLGKVASGLELLKPQNFDALFLIVAFGLTMWLAQKFTVKTSQPKEGEQVDEQTRIQQDTMKILPIVMTGTFFFIPLPVGVLIYIVLSNCVQSFQTWILMKRPVPPLVSVLDDEDGPIIDSGSGGGGAGSGGGGGSKSPKSSKSGASAKDGSKNAGGSSSGSKASKKKTTDAASVKDFAKKKREDKGQKIKINPADGKVTVSAGEKDVSGEPSTQEKKKKKKK